MSLCLIYQPLCFLFLFSNLQFPRQNPLSSSSPWLPCRRLRLRRRAEGARLPDRGGASAGDPFAAALWTPRQRKEHLGSSLRSEPLGRRSCHPGCEAGGFGSSTPSPKQCTTLRRYARCTKIAISGRDARIADRILRND